MEKITITLNDFLFNSGVVGFQKILELQEKEDLIESKGNTLIVDTQAFEEFDKDYIQAMLETFEKDTRWYKLTSSAKTEAIQKLDLQQKEQIKQLEEYIAEVKKAIESNSYKAGLEIIQKEKQTDDPNVIQQTHLNKK